MTTKSRDRGHDSKLPGGESKRVPMTASVDCPADAVNSTIRFCSPSRDEAGGIPRRLIHSPRETETLLGVSHAGIYRLIAAGRLKAVKVGTRTGITRESIEAVAAGETLVIAGKVRVAD